MHRNTIRRGRRWLAALALPAALAVGCGDGDRGPRAATPTAAATTTPPPATATPTPDASARAACDKLVRCGQCFADSTGRCIPVDACARRLAADAAICINAGAGCAADALGDCLFLGCDGADPGAECQ